MGYDRSRQIQSPISYISTSILTHYKLSMSQQPSAPPMPLEVDEQSLSHSPRRSKNRQSKDEWLQTKSNGGGHFQNDNKNSQTYVDPFCIPDYAETATDKAFESSKLLDKKVDHFGRTPDGFIEGLDVGDDLDCTTKLLTVLSLILVFITFPLSMFFCLKIVAEYERAVVLRMGRLLPRGQGTKGPGLFFILPCLDNVRKVELRTVTFDIPPQEVLTRDSVTVAVDAVVYYRICNPAVSVLNVEDAARSTRLLAQTTLRNVLGTKDLAQILMDREEMSQTMQTTIDLATEAWGVKVERVEIKDVRLPVQLQRAMAAEAEATREARAKVIAAGGEHDASKSLKEAARIISSSPLALHLRYLQTLCTISAEKNSTIIFPLPIDIMQNLGGTTAARGESRTSMVKKWLPALPHGDKDDLIVETANSAQRQHDSSTAEEDEYDGSSDSV